MMKKKRKTILICDDDEGILEMISLVLRQKGYTVVSLTESKLVLETAGKINPFVILLDIWISDGNGDELTRLLKKHTLTRHIPVVLVSANRFTEEIAKETGADDFLCKPFDVAELEHVVERFA